MVAGILKNPRTAPAWTIAISLTLLVVGGALSSVRIRTSLADSSSSSIASYRASLCRVIGGGEKVELGATYYQPDEEGRKTRMEEGSYGCDPFGGSFRTSRTGVAEHVVNVAPETVNETLIERLKNPANPDSDPKKRIRRDWDIPIYQAPKTEPDFLIEQLQEQKGDLNNGN